MPRHKSLVAGSRIVCAGRRRKCYHDRSHVIQGGQICLEVREGLGWKGYCAACARTMIELGRAKLTGLLQEIEQLAH